MEFNSVIVSSCSEQGSEAKALNKIESSQPSSKERQQGPNSLGLFGKIIALSQTILFPDVAGNVSLHEQELSFLKYKYNCGKEKKKQ